MLKWKCVTSEGYTYFHTFVKTEVVGPHTQRLSCICIRWPSTNDLCSGKGFPHSWGLLESRKTRWNRNAWRIGHRLPIWDTQTAIQLLRVPWRYWPKEAMLVTKDRKQISLYSFVYCFINLQNAHRMSTRSWVLLCAGDTKRSKNGYGLWPSGPTVHLVLLSVVIILPKCWNLET